MSETTDEIQHRLNNFHSPSFDRDIVQRLMDENMRFQEIMHEITSWIEAYPLKIFPEPDLGRAHAILSANNMSLDAISASNMRHVLKGIKGIIERIEGDKSDG